MKPMKPTLDDFAATVAAMRASQRAFFAAEPGSAARRVHLNIARRLEAQVDRELNAIYAGKPKPGPQQALFNEEEAA